MSRCRRRVRRDQGFTLIEVMVSLVIVAVALTAISVTMGGMLNTAATLRDRTYASWIAQNKIVEIRAAGAFPDTGESSGEVDYAKGEWEWRAVIAETGVEDLLRIDVSVSRPGDDDPIRTVTGFVGEPVVPGQSNRVWIAGAFGAGARSAGDEDPDDDDEARN